MFACPMMMCRTDALDVNRTTITSANLIKRPPHDGDVRQLKTFQCRTRFASHGVNGHRLTATLIQIHWAIAHAHSHTRWPDAKWALSYTFNGTGAQLLWCFVLVRWPHRLARAQTHPNPTTSSGAMCPVVTAASTSANASHTHTHKPDCH